ncbi:sigma factor-like helix-turn-helix DNA-binding protein [Streptomyces sp. YH02]|uniref:sigma factor-like helix-turn-helix DNA-binding protein n=1 Tax=Streptomyces sp. YH02 TaxID=3256999 RepID=UPI003756EA8B
MSRVVRYPDAKGVRTGSKKGFLRQLSTRFRSTPQTRDTIIYRNPTNHSGPAPAADLAPPTAESAFDALYLSTVPGLTQQAYVLTGCRRLAFESAEHAFHQVWERWPEVARDPDPAGWARARTHEYALSPWHRLRPGLNRRDPLPSDPVAQVLLRLPPWQRRAVLLCDGLDLSVAETAAETQATIDATAARLRNARVAFSRQMPDTTAGTSLDALRKRVKDVSVATLAQPWSVRAASERRARTLTRAVFGATATLITLVAVTSAMAPPPGAAVDESRAHRRTVQTARE